MVEQDGEIVGVIEIETVLTGDVHMKDGANAASLLAFGWFEGQMRSIARSVGFGGYEFFVSNKQPSSWRRFIKRHFPVGKGIKKPGTFYYRSFQDGQK